MLLGNAGVVTAISSLILTFVGQGESGSLALRIVLLVTGLVALWAIATSRWVDRRLSRLIDRALKRYTQLDVTDYASLMQLVGAYRVVELHVNPEDWIAHKTLTESALRDEGILVLGIQRPNGTYIGTPTGDTQVLPDDTLVLYGRVSALQEIDRRRRDRHGDREHQEAVEEQQQVVAEEEQSDVATTTDS